MATLTVKNLPDELYAALTRTAKRNRRSINGEVIVTLERTLGRQATDLEETIDNFRRIREKNKAIWVTEADIDLAKNEGRL